MMMKCKLPLLALVLVSAGCTDDVNSVTREYRATTNEAIDAMMMVTDEASALRMTVRVFKPMSDRYKAIDRKMMIVRSNRERPDFVKEVFEADGVQIYLTDLEVNRQRYALEITRLRKVYETEIKAGEVCPNLEELAKKNKLLEPLRKQLMEPDLLKLMKDFPKWKVADYDKMFVKFAERRATFLPKEDIKLAW